MILNLDNAVIGAANTVIVTGADCEVVQAQASLGDRHAAQTDRKRLDLTAAISGLTAAFGASSLDFPEAPLALKLPQTPSPVGNQLAFAVAVLMAMQTTPDGRVPDTVFLGNLTNTGLITPVRGTLPALVAASDAGYRRVVVSAATPPEELLVSDIEVLCAVTLGDVVAWLGGDETRVKTADFADGAMHAKNPDLSRLIGQPDVRWAAEVAAGGGHHIFAFGPPESVDVVPRYIQAVLPDLPLPDAYKVASMHSLAGRVRSPRDTRPPLVTADCSDCAANLLGGELPGLVTCAHRGVLALDSESLRHAATLNEPSRIWRHDTIYRVLDRQTVTYPAAFQLVATLPTCPNHPTPPASTVWHKSGAPSSLFDYIALRVAMRTTPARGDTLDLHATRIRVTRARQISEQRWERHGGPWTNATVPWHILNNPAFRLPEDVTAPLTQWDLPPVAAKEIIRMTWTIADLLGAREPVVDHLRAAHDLHVGHGSDYLLCQPTVPLRGPDTRWS